MHRTIRALAAIVLFAAPACTMEQGGDQPDTAATAAPPVQAAPDTAAQARPPASDLRVEVDLASRKLNLLRGSEQLSTWGVAVGSSEWPTQTGEWTIKQVVWNPEWVPPQESWAKDEEPKQPGDADNPLGRVQLVYDPPRTIHGTNEPQSIGKAVSHGSIRMTNASAIELAKRVMEAGGAAKDDAWIQRVQSNRREKVIVDLPSPVPIRVQ